MERLITRLGMHQILVLSYDARVTANFSKGKKAKDLATICEGYGF